MRVKKRIFAGAVCEQEVFSVSDRTRNIAKAQYKPEARTAEERERHNRMIGRRHHERLINENFSPSSLYSTLTFDNVKYTIGTKRGTFVIYIIAGLNMPIRKPAFVYIWGAGRTQTEYIFICSRTAYRPK